jgi:sulfur carrier protein
MPAADLHARIFASLPSPPPDPDLVIALTINGEPRRFDAPLKVESLLGVLELTGKRIALARNGDIVPRSRFGQEWLADGDRIEIVVAVGGG